MSVTEKIAQKIISLPVYPGLSTKDANIVVSALIDFFDTQPA